MSGSTLTHRVAALQIKMLHIQFRMQKIYNDQADLHSKVFNTNREKIRGLRPATYTTVDMLVTLEHASRMIQEIFSTPEVSKHLTTKDRQILVRSKAAAERWQKVRNKLGGHIDMDIVEATCQHHGFKGVFLSDDLETDVSVLNALLIESAVNSTGFAEKEFGRKIDLRRNIAGELQLITDKLNQDWEEVFSYFKPMMERLYAIGKDEKIAATHPSQRHGLVVGN